MLIPVVISSIPIKIVWAVDCGVAIVKNSERIEKNIKSTPIRPKEAGKYRRYHLKKALAKMFLVHFFQLKYCVLLRILRKKEVCTAKKKRKTADRHIKEKQNVFLQAAQAK